MEQNIIENKEVNSEQDDQKFEELMGKVSPELLLNLNKAEISKTPSGPIISGAGKLVIFIGLLDLVIALILNFITNESHISILGYGLIALSIPWQLAFVDGLLFAGYGFYVVKTKHGELDTSNSSHGIIEVQEVTGEAASALGILYIFLGLFLVGVVIVRLFIQGIF